MVDAEKFEQAKIDVDEYCKLLEAAVRETTSKLTKSLDDIVKELSKGINLYSNQELWDFQVRLGIEAYILGNYKEQGYLRELCSDALYKEELAMSFTGASGTQENKKQQALINTIEKHGVAMVYASTSSLLKTKCDEAHRLVNILQGIQISRAAEAKQAASPRNEQDKVNYGA